MIMTERKGAQMSKGHILLRLYYHKIGNQLLCVQAGTTVTSGAIHPRNGDTPEDFPSSETPILRHQVSYESIRSIICMASTMRSSKLAA